MDTTEERWLPIVGYENYEVSDLGRVKNVKTDRILKVHTDKSGYCRITPCKDKKKCNQWIHRLVLMTFFPIEEIKEVNHRNHIKNDNRLCNLEWCSSSENMRFQKKREGLLSQYKGVSYHKNAKKWVVQCSLNGKSQHIGTFDDEHDAGRAYNEFVIKNDLQHFTILNDLSLLSP